MGKRTHLMVWFGLLPVAGVVFYLFYFASPAPPNKNTVSTLTYLEIPIGWIATLLGLTVLVAIHELGHILAVKWAHWELRSVQVFLVGLKLHEGRWRPCFPWNARQSGFVTYWPRHATAKSGLVIAAAGPAFSLAAAVALGVLAWQQKGGWAIAVGTAAVVSALLGFGSLVPSITRQGMLSDGQQILMYARDRGLYESWLDIVELNSLMPGSRPRDLDPASLAPWKSSEPYRAYLQLLRFWTELDVGNVLAAMTEVEGAWRLVAALRHYGPLQATLAFETAMFFTRFVADPELAAKASELGMQTDPASKTRKAVEAAKLFVDGKPGRARFRLMEARREWETLGGISERVWEHIDDWYARILDPAIPTLTREQAEAAIAQGDYPRLLEPLTPEPQSA
jgi:hypothetical protein